MAKRPEIPIAEVIYGGTPRSRPARHAILIVQSEGDHYLVDVGFGRNGLIKPLLLKNNKTIEARVHDSQFQIAYQEEYGFLYGYFFGGKYNLEYRFDLFSEERQNAWHDLGNIISIRLKIRTRYLPK